MLLQFRSSLRGLRANGTRLVSDGQRPSDQNHVEAMRPDRGPKHRVAWTAGVDALHPTPDLGSCDADVLRAPKLEHAVQHVGGDGHLSVPAPVALRA